VVLVDKYWRTSSQIKNLIIIILVFLTWKIKPGVQIRFPSITPEQGGMIAAS